MMWKKFLQNNIAILLKLYKLWILKIPMRKRPLNKKKKKEIFINYLK